MNKHKIKTLWFFIIYGVPEVWKSPRVTKAAWLASKLTAITTKLKNEKKNE